MSRVTLDFMRNGGETSRYHTWPVLRRQSVAEHSFHVAMLCSWLSNDYPSAALLQAALVHDLAEHIVGDVPAPMKRELHGFRDAWNEFESKLLTDANILNKLLSPEEAQILKFADAADGALYCVRERAMGNKLINKVYKTYLEYLKEQHDETNQRQTDLIKYIKRSWKRARK